MLGYYLKGNHLHIIKNLFTSLTVVDNSAKTTRTLWICVPVDMSLVLVLNVCLLQEAVAHFLGMALVKS